MNSEKSISDASTFSNSPSISGDKNNDGKPTTQFDPNELYYNMSGEKYLLIFNHFTFMKTTQYRNLRPCDRKDTEEDVNGLKRIFQKLNYKVLVYNNLVYDDIINTIHKISIQDHSKTACLCIAILTHGDKNEKLYAADMPYALEDITIKLENGDQGLVGKPKLFFIQACRGDNLDSRAVQFDDTGRFMVIPRTADFLFLRSSIEDHLSFRNAYGSFMIQALCQVMEDNCDKTIHYITTLVNMHLSRYYSTNMPDHNMNQMIVVKHSLTKLFNF